MTVRKSSAIRRRAARFVRATWLGTYAVVTLTPLVLMVFVEHLAVPNSWIAASARRIHTEQFDAP